LVNSFTNDRLYKQTFAYNTFSHLTNRNSNVWTAFYSITDAYVNNRRAGWDYGAGHRTGQVRASINGAGLILLLKCLVLQFGPDPAIWELNLKDPIVTAVNL